MDSAAREGSTDGGSAEVATTGDLPALVLPEDAPDDEVVVRTARLWDVSQESAALRLRLQDADGALKAALADRFPEVFVERKAGLRGEHIYLLSDDAAELRRAITEVYRDAGVGPEHLVFERVPLSSAELRAREEAATRVVSRQAARHGVTHWFVDTDARSGVIDVEVDERNPAFSEAVRAELEHEVRFTVTGPVEPA